MLRTRENSDVFNSLDEIYLVFTPKKQISSIPTSTFQIRDTEVMNILCGIGTKLNLISSKMEWLIYFYSDYTINKSGFELTFVTIDGK